MIFLLPRSYNSHMFLSLALSNLIMLWIAAAFSRLLMKIMPIWMIGGMGFLLIASAIYQDDETPPEGIGLWKLIMFCVSLGGDNLAFLIPWTIHVSFQDLLTASVVFCICSYGLVLLGRVLLRLSAVTRIVERFAPQNVKLLYMLAGLYIVLKSNFLGHLWGLLQQIM